jgi:hypothetical protein
VRKGDNWNIRSFVPKLGLLTTSQVPHPLTFRVCLPGDFRAAAWRGVAGAHAMLLCESLLSDSLYSGISK